MARQYGSDQYWIERYERSRRGENGDETDEWLLGWDQLQPLLCTSKLRKGSAVLDCGCGSSTLALDMVCDPASASYISHVVAVDIAPGAIHAQVEAAARLLSQGESAAKKVTFAVLDMSLPGSTTSCFSKVGGFDLVVDKSTTDGMLCDVKDGGRRVRTMYENVGAALCTTALVAVCSWKDPESDGMDWLIDLVLGGLRSGYEEHRAGGDQASTAVPVWALDVHTIVNGAERGPHVYLLHVSERRRSPRQRKRPRMVFAREQEGGGEEDVEADMELAMRHHLHEVIGTG
jgi:SAM-dependent methyltransferase